MRSKPDLAPDCACSRPPPSSKRWVWSPSPAPGGGLHYVGGYRRSALHGMLAPRNEPFDVSIATRRVLMGLIGALALACAGCTTNGPAPQDRNDKSGLRADCTGNEYTTGPVFFTCSAP